VVACDPHEIVLDNHLGEDHVLYCLENVLIVMTIWKWSLTQTILDGYPLRTHLSAFNETHIPNDEDVGIVGVNFFNFFS